MGFSYLQVKGKEILDRQEHRACYIDIFNDGVAKGADAIILFQHYLSVPLTEFKKWIAIINREGFYCTYSGLGDKLHNIQEEYHVVRIDLKKYRYKNQLTSALSLIRYGFENKRKIDSFFEAKEKYPHLTTIEIICLCGSTVQESGHCVGSPGFKLLNRKQLFKEFRKQKMPLYSKGMPKQMNSAWCRAEDKVLGFIGPLGLEQAFRRLTKINSMKVYVVGGSTNYANWLPNTEVTHNFNDADVVMFTGGEDVDPSLYGEQAGRHTYSNLERDIAEREVYKRAKEARKKIIGICRGSQFLCVMAGGKLIQHQDNPNAVHEIALVRGGAPIHITSTHHQAAYPYNLPIYVYKLLGWSRDKQSTFHLNGEGKEMLGVVQQEAEIVWYKNERSLGIQGHPEMINYQKAHPESLKVIQEIYKDFINNQL